MASLCHPWFTTTNLFYRFPLYETSATALCGITGNLSFRHFCRIAAAWMPSFLWALTGWKNDINPIAHCSLMLSLVTDDCPLKNRWLPGDSGESGCEVQTIALPVDTWAGSWFWNRCQFLGWPCSPTARRSRSTGGTGSGAEDAAYKSGYGGHSILNGDSCHGEYFDVLDRCRPGMCIWVSLKDCNQTNISRLRNFSLVPFTRWQRHFGQSIWNTGVWIRVHDM